MHRLHFSPDSISNSPPPCRRGFSEVSTFKARPEHISDGGNGAPSAKVSNAFRSASRVIEANRAKRAWIPSVGDSRIIGKLLVEANELHAVIPSIKPGAQMAVFFGYYLSQPHIEFSALQKEFGKTKATSAIISVSRQLGKWGRKYYRRKMGPRLWARTGYHLPLMPEEELARYAKSTKLPSNWHPSVSACRAITAIINKEGETENFQSRMTTPVMRAMFDGYYLPDPPVPYAEFSGRFGRNACAAAMVMIGRRLGKWYREYLKRDMPETGNASE